MLERIGLALDVEPADLNEAVLVGEAPAPYVQRIAREKALVVARRNPDRWVLAADTTVTIAGAILGKAESPEEAAAMLRALSGQTHQVLTAFVIVCGETAGPTLREEVVSTDVTMIELSERMLADYVASDEWRGKAGAYAIQGIAAAFVRSVHGSVTNVIGLPMAEVIAALHEVGGPEPRFASGAPA